MCSFSELVLAWEERKREGKRESQRQREKVISLYLHVMIVQIQKLVLIKTSRGSWPHPLSSQTHSSPISPSAVNTHTHVVSELHKQTQAKIPGRNEEMMKQLSAVSWLVERGRGEKWGVGV